MDDGILSVARFYADGSLHWPPLVWGQGPLTAANGFASQADVLLETRRAADLLGATPMDSPKAFEADPGSGHVVIALTGNEARTKGDASNPRPANEHGHILRLVPPGAAPDHGADVFAWRIFLLCGDPANPADRAAFHPDTSEQGWFVEPDNIAFDPSGRLWVCSDGPGARNHDGLWVMDVAGPPEGLPRLFYSPPIQSECCSSAFTPDGETMFLAIQHPAERADSRCADRLARFQARPAAPTVADRDWTQRAAIRPIRHATIRNTMLYRGMTPNCHAFCVTKSHAAAWVR